MYGVGFFFKSNHCILQKLVTAVATAAPLRPHPKERGKWESAVNSSQLCNTSSGRMKLELVLYFTGSFRQIYVTCRVEYAIWERWSCSTDWWQLWDWGPVSGEQWNIHLLRREAWGHWSRERGWELNGRYCQQKCLWILISIWFLFPRTAIHLQTKATSETLSAMQSYMSHRVPHCPWHGPKLDDGLIYVPENTYSARSILNSSISRCKFTGRAAASFKIYVCFSLPLHLRVLFPAQFPWALPCNPMTRLHWGLTTQVGMPPLYTSSASQGQLGMCSASELINYDGLK